jgi:hypothetical protein
MKIVVFGPDKRTGALRDGNVVDLSHACAKYQRERAGESAPREMAEALVPSNLARLIEGGRAHSNTRRSRSTTSSIRRRTNSARAARRSFFRQRKFACTRRGPIMRALPAPEETSPTTLPQWL